MISIDESVVGPSDPESSDADTESVDPNWLPTWELVVLAVGDFLTLLVFSAIGRASHGMQEGGGFVSLFDTAVPFMLAFLLAGIILGLYRGKALYPVGRVIWKTGLTALIAGPAGVALRSLWLGRPIILSFVLVGTLSSMVMLTLWRVAWSRLRRLWWPELP